MNTTLRMHKPWVADQLALYFRISSSFQWRIANPKSRRYANLKYLLARDELQDLSFKCFEDIIRLSKREGSPHHKCMQLFDGSIKDNIHSSKEAQKWMNICVSNWIKLEYDIRKNHIALNKQLALEMEDWNMTKNKVTLFDIIGHLELSGEDKILLDWKMDLIEDEDAMKALDCSERTLYNRWNKLREAILGNKDLSKLKTLSVYTKWMSAKENGAIKSPETEA